MPAKRPDSVEWYGLFGEVPGGDNPEFIHIEDIQTRSSLYEWRITPHLHRRMFQIVFIVEGPATVHLDGKVREVAGPASITIPGGVVHSFTFSPKTVGYVVTVSEVLLVDARYRRSRKIFEPLMRDPAIIEFPADDRAAGFAAGVLTQMMAEFLTPLTVGRSSMLEWLLRSVMMVIRRQLDVEASARDAKGYERETFLRFGQLVEDHYREHWPVTAYADSLAMSQARLNRLCMGFSGKTALDLVHGRLALEAQRLLTYTSATAAMVAYELGFQDPAYFSRFFRRQTGRAPGAFRSEAAGGVMPEPARAKEPAQAIKA